VPKACPS